MVAGQTPDHDPFFRHRPIIALIPCNRKTGTCSSPVPVMQYPGTGHGLLFFSSRTLFVLGLLSRMKTTGRRNVHSGFTCRYLPRKAHSSANVFPIDLLSSSSDTAQNLSSLNSSE